MQAEVNNFPQGRFVRTYGEREVGATCDMGYACAAYVRVIVFIFCAHQTAYFAKGILSTDPDIGQRKLEWYIHAQNGTYKELIARA